MMNEAAVYRERYAAARSLRNWWTRLASTAGCMDIAVTPSDIIVKPGWHARWLIRLLALDLEHCISVGRIIAVTKKGRVFPYRAVELEYADDEGHSQRLWLYLRDDEKFADAVETVRGGAGRD